mmetsp:Transcript_45620/g.111041  ORF Transcript_45620/g.111041 Transcript_45620/m.111041 type:complete len:226 (-) Transcript_45620:1506-2183(-)
MATEATDASHGHRRLQACLQPPVAAAAALLRGVDGALAGVALDLLVGVRSVLVAEGLLRALQRALPRGDLQLLARDGVLARVDLLGDPRHVCQQLREHLIAPLIHRPVHARLPALVLLHDELDAALLGEVLRHLDQVPLHSPVQARGADLVGHAEEPLPAHGHEQPRHVELVTRRGVVQARLPDPRLYEEQLVAACLEEVPYDVEEAAIRCPVEGSLPSLVLDEH